MKISIIGAGNVGGTTALRLAQTVSADIFLIDIASGLSLGKAYDLEDARKLVGTHYLISGSEHLQDMLDSDIVIVTAGLARKPGMTREDLLNKNARILKEICLAIKEVASNAIVVIVTNPLDLMTRVALQVTGFSAGKVFGMGVSLDAARFANLISKETLIPVIEIEPLVIGSHGEGMMPLRAFTKVRGKSLDVVLDPAKIKELTAKTVGRGLEIVTLLGSGSAYFAPSAAIVEIVKIIVSQQPRVIGLSAYLNGEYGAKDVCIGVPCRLGKDGIEQIVELKLNTQESQDFLNSCARLKTQFSGISF